MCFSETKDWKNVELIIAMKIAKSQRIYVKICMDTSLADVVGNYHIEYIGFSKKLTSEAVE